MLSAAVWLALWYFAAEKVALDVILPSPVSVIKAFASLLPDPVFYRSCLFSFVRIIIGWAAGLAAGAVFGLLIFSGKVFDALFSPVLHVIKATPVASFIVLFLVILKNSYVPSVIAALIVIPVVCENVKGGLSSPDAKLTEMASVFEMSAKNKIKHIYLPAVMPYFFASARTSMGLAWKAGIAAEVICLPALSLGKAIYDSKVYLDTPYLFAWTAAVIILSVALERMIVLSAKKITGKEEKAG